MTDEVFHLAVLMGSVRDGRFNPVVTEWFAGRAKQRRDLTVDVIDLADGVDGLAERIAAADATIVVTPEYNHSFPAPLKDAVDAAGAGWAGKPVGFVSYGGISGGLRAVEHLRGVFAELNAVTVRETVSFHLAHGEFDGRGSPRDPGAVNAAATALLDQLAWWALALRRGRAARAFPS